MSVTLTDDMQRVVREQRLGFWATVDAGGAPMVSPKGTTDVWDDNHLWFADVHSPHTVDNIRRGSYVEVNVVDPFVRKGFRFAGSATVHGAGSPEFAEGVARMRANGSALADQVQAIVVLAVERAEPLVSPAYDDPAATEAQIRSLHTARFARLHADGAVKPDLTAEDRAHLRRCVELAAAAVDAGDEPFGSVLVDATGAVRAEDRNRVNTLGDETRHPEFELARWAATNLDAGERAASTVYTSGEHCPMCSAAHAWVGLGRIVYATSGAQLGEWRRGWGMPAGGVAAFGVAVVAPQVAVAGPDPELTEAVRALHVRASGLTDPG